MRGRLRFLLVYGFALGAMTYSIWAADLSVLPVASAEWTNGCCVGSNECPGNFICWNKPAGWADCSVTYYYDSQCDCWVPIIKPNYCNPMDQPPGQEGGKGPGGFLD